MVKKKLLLIFSILISILLAVNFTYAVQNFSVNPTSFSLTTNLNTQGSGLITVTNTGNESINLSISKIDLTKGSDVLALSLDKTSISNLVNGTNTNLNFNYNKTTVSGTYTGSILIKNSQNSSQNISIPINLVVNLAVNPNANLEIVGESSTITFNSDIGNTERLNLRFKNTGTVNLTNIRFTRKDLQGVVSSDKIRNSDINFDTSSFNLNIGDSNTVEIRINVPNNIAADQYLGSFTVTTDQGNTFSWNLDVTLSGANIDVIIDQNRNSVINGLLTISGDQGGSLRGYEFLVDNRGNVDANNLIFELNTNLVEENSGKIIPSSAITIIPNSLDLRRNQDDTVEIRVNIPVNQELGNYFANIRVKSSTGVEYDKILLKVEVRGDIYIKNIVFPNDIVPGDSFDLKVILKNKGLQLHRNVKITGTLLSIDNSDTDLIETSPTFLLDLNSEKTQILKFNIPKDASDGSHTLEIKVQYDNLEFTQIKDVNFKRPKYGIEINSFSVNPTIISCEKELSSFMKIENLGKYDESIKVQTEIIGTTIKKTSNFFEIKVNEIRQKNTNLDISNLKSGNYNVVQKVIFAGSLFKKKTTAIQIVDCNKFKIGVNINTTIPEIINNETIGSNKIQIFGTQIEKSSIYLITGLSIIIILIIVSLFLL